MIFTPLASDRILLAGDSSLLPQFREALATLGPKSTGQVFIEVDSADQIESLATPPRFSVSWLLRSRGQELRRSVDAWLSEMLPVSGVTEHRVYAWIGADSARVLSSN
jgi:NADPH-dependent ferric siderophore reductase